MSPSASRQNLGAEGAYEDGDVVMGPQVLLNGADRDGEKVRAGRNTFDLLGCRGAILRAVKCTLSRCLKTNGIYKEFEA